MRRRDTTRSQKPATEGRFDHDDEAQPTAEEISAETERLRAEFQREANRGEPERVIVFRGPLPRVIALPDPEVIRDQIRTQVVAEFAALREPVGNVEAAVAKATQNRFALVMLELQRTLLPEIDRLISKHVTEAINYACGRDRRSIHASDNPPSGHLNDDHLGRALKYRWSRDVLCMNGLNAMNFVAKAERMTVPDESQSGVIDSAIRQSVGQGRKLFKKLWLRVMPTNAPKTTTFAHYQSLAMTDVSVEHPDHGEIMRIRRMLKGLMEVTEHVLTTRE